MSVNPGDILPIIFQLRAESVICFLHQTLLTARDFIPSFTYISRKILTSAKLEDHRILKMCFVLL